MYINEMNYVVHGELKDGIPSYHNFRKDISVAMQDKNIFLSDSNRKIYRKYNQYFEGKTKFNFFLHVFPDKEYYYEISKEFSSTILGPNNTGYPVKDGECNIHFLENWAGRDFLCLTPWMLVHRTSHTFSNLDSRNSSEYLDPRCLQKIFKCFDLKKIKDDKERDNITRYINCDYENNEGFQSHVGLGLYPDMISEINAFLLRGKAARTGLRIIDVDALGEFLAAHHFGKGKFTFQDQNNIDEDFLLVSKEQYLSTIIEAEKSITKYIDNLYNVCSGKNLVI